MSKHKENISKTAAQEPEQMPFAKQNYYLMGGGFLLVLIGFFVMYVGVEDRGNSDVIYSFGKTTLPVIFILLGFLVTGVGIMKRFNR